MITFETTEQDGITRIYQKRPAEKHEYWVLRTITISGKSVRAPDWERNLPSWIMWARHNKNL